MTLIAKEAPAHLKTEVKMKAKKAVLKGVQSHKANCTSLTFQQPKTLHSGGSPKTWLERLHEKQAEQLCHQQVPMGTESTMKRT